MEDTEASISLEPESHSPAVEAEAQAELQHSPHDTEQHSQPVDAVPVPATLDSPPQVSSTETRVEALPEEPQAQSSSEVEEAAATTVIDDAPLEVEVPLEQHANPDPATTTAAAVVAAVPEEAPAATPTTSESESDASSETQTPPQGDRPAEPPIELVDGFSYTAASVAPDEVSEPPIPPSFTVESSGSVVDDSARVLPKVRSNHRILDQQLLDELEENATACAENVSHLLGSLRSALHAITGMSVDYMMTYRSSVDSVGENVTNSILVMNTFIRNARQLNDGLKGAQHLQEEIKQIKRHLDVLEANVTKMRRPSGAK